MTFRLASVSLRGFQVGDTPLILFGIRQRSGPEPGRGVDRCRGAHLGIRGSAGHRRHYQGRRSVIGVLSGLLASAASRSCARQASPWSRHHREWPVTDACWFTAPATRFRSLGRSLCNRNACWRGCDGRSYRRV
jgi:hypothetical protein